MKLEAGGGLALCAPADRPWTIAWERDDWLARTIHEAPAKCTLNADLSPAAARAPHSDASIT
jgi:hypothetical protein